MFVLVTLEFTDVTDIYRKSSITQRDVPQVYCVYIATGNTMTRYIDA